MMFDIKSVVNRSVLLASVLVSGVALAVAPPADSGSSKKKSKPKETPEVVAAAKATVFGQLDESVANGEKRFNQSCVYCHGNRGSGGKAKKLQGRDFEPEYLFKTISNGKRRGALVMPPWKRSFSPEQRWELVTYILSLSNSEK
ncbi:c-type cytochrome [Pontibacter sp. JAM-7]|uniref:c-type cytochrome n=1 Tax=Pontibacter sp. JAM-7 TaxID=3366581 RepID=UPI003AF5CFF0